VAACEPVLPREVLDEGGVELAKQVRAVVVRHGGQHRCQPLRPEAPGQRLLLLGRQEGDHGSLLLDRGVVEEAHQFAVVELLGHGRQAGRMERLEHLGNPRSVGLGHQRADLGQDQGGEEFIDDAFGGHCWLGRWAQARTAWRAMPASIRRKTSSWRGQITYQ
jgi:hypothetical protein